MRAKQGINLARELYAGEDEVTNQYAASLKEVSSNVDSPYKRK